MKQNEIGLAVTLSSGARRLPRHRMKDFPLCIEHYEGVPRLLLGRRRVGGDLVRVESSHASACELRPSRRFAFRRGEDDATQTEHDLRRDGVTNAFSEDGSICGSG